MTERGQTRQQTSGVGTPDAGTTSGSAPDAAAPAGGATGGEGAPAVERRRNPRLRELVDEMLASVRVAARRDLWSAEERKQYEAELAEIMRRVRFEAIHASDAKDGQREPDGGSGGTA